MKFKLLFFQLLLFPYMVIFPQQGLSKSYYANDTLKSKINYSNNIREGKAKFFYPNGELEEEVNYHNGKIEGLVKLYSDSGKIKETYNIQNGKREGPASIFSNDGIYLTSVEFHEGKLVIKNKANENGSNPKAINRKSKEEKFASDKIVTERKEKLSYAVPPPKIEEENLSNDPAYFLTAEIMPKPVGGMKALLSTVYYPKEAREKKITGIVKIKAFIDQFGDVNKAEVVKGIGYGCDEAAKIAVYYAKFKPGLIKGQPIRVQMIIPIKFPPEDDKTVGK